MHWQWFILTSCIVHKHGDTRVLHTVRTTTHHNPPQPTTTHHNPPRPPRTQQPTTPQPHNPTTPQPHNPTTPQPHDPTIPRSHDPTIPQSHNPTTPQPHNPTTPQSPSPTHPPPRLAGLTYPWGSEASQVLTFQVDLSGDVSQSNVQKTAMNILLVQG